MSWTFTWGLSLSRKAISQVSSACKLIPPLPHIPFDKVLVYRKGKKTLFCLFFSLLSLFFIHPRSVFLLYTLGAAPCGECLTYAIQLVGNFCLCEWAAVSLSKL